MVTTRRQGELLRQLTNQRPVRTRGGARRRPARVQLPRQTTNRILLATGRRPVRHWHLENENWVVKHYKKKGARPIPLARLLHHEALLQQHLEEQGLDRPLLRFGPGDLRRARAAAARKRWRTTNAGAVAFRSTEFARRLDAVNPELSKRIVAFAAMAAGGPDVHTRHPTRLY